MCKKMLEGVMVKAFMPCDNIVRGKIYIYKYIFRIQKVMFESSICYTSVPCKHWTHTKSSGLQTTESTES